MPELPDVEAFKKYMDATALHQQIEDVRVAEERVLRDISATKLRKGLKGNELDHTKRYGKHLLANLGGENWLVLHFGMTGYLKYFKDEDTRPQHARVLLDFTNGYHLAYVCQRLFGEVWLFSGDLDRFVETEELGVDAAEVGWEEFQEIMRSRRGSIKSAFMNQSIIAGLGNVYTDEILFQTRIHPKTEVSKLEEKQIRSLFETMKEVLNTAVDRWGDPGKLPDSYLLPHREKGGTCPRRHGELKTMKVNSRTTYYCPECQRRQ
jgi:formamidopyrimidine-DNA glycosylase